MNVDVVVQKIKLPRAMPPVLGVGAYLKNALCLIQGDEAWISRENGSLDTVASLEAFTSTAAAMLDLAQEKPVAVAHDWHPDFFCTRWAQETGLRTVGIQHHHAHIAAVMAECGVEEPVLGLALDGFGLGANNEAWGGELLRVHRDGFERLGHLRPLPQPGGDSAARQPWRMGAAALWAMGRGSEIASRYAAFPGASQLATMMDRGLNAPMTTSAGRLFDAACGLLNVKPVASFEGEAPMALERIAADSILESSRDSIRLESNRWRLESNRDSLVLDVLPLLAEVDGLETAKAAVLFHLMLAAALIDWVKKASQRTGIKTIAMGGGCFFNKLLRQEMEEGLYKEGMKPLLPLHMMPGDTTLALGQAYAAALLIENEG